MTKGYKDCQDCGTSNWVRAKNCQNCHSPFVNNKKQNHLPSGKRGSKACPICSALNGPRSFLCKVCGHEFLFEKLKNQVDWKTLKKGDIIKVMSSGGPYFVTTKESFVAIKNHETGKTEYKTTQAGTRIAMNHPGIFKVHKIKSDGMVVYGKQRKNKGYVFIYMGKSTDSEHGTRMEPHRIKKITKARQSKYASVYR